MVQACSANECGETSAEVCVCGGDGSDLHQPRLRHRPRPGYPRPNFANVPDGPRAIHRINPLQRRRNARDGTLATAGSTLRMRIIVAPDKFKDCLSAPKVAEAIAAGLKLADPYAQIDLCPMGDGGEGTVDALVKATNGKFVTQGVTGPIPGTIVGATMGFLGDGTTAVIEMAAASGLHLLRPDERNPMKTTTYGTGELIKRALEEGAKEIILGIGGSATVDGGLGALQACGAKIFVQREGSDAVQELTQPATG